MIDPSVHYSLLFKETIRELLISFEIEEVIETGTYLGNGSTKIFADLAIRTKSIECNIHNYSQALLNRPEKFITILYGLSLNKSDILYHLESDKILEDEKCLDYPEILFDTSIGGREFYKNEIFKNLVEPYEENLLTKNIDNNKRQLIYLDSSGGIGFLEYIAVMKLPLHKLKNKILVLDDVNHIKHFRSVQHLIKNGYNFNYAPDLRFGWCNLNPYKINI